MGVPEGAHWRIIEVEAHHITYEDVDGPKDKQGKYPRTDYYARDIHQGFEVGDWVGMKVYLLYRPEKKVKRGTD